MSRQNIDLTQPLSEDERAYLEARNMTNELDLNALYLMGGGVSEDEVDEEHDSEDTYKGWKKADWEGEVARRNAERDEADQIVPDGQTRDAFKDAVLADDAKSANAAE